MLEVRHIALDDRDVAAYFTNSDSITLADDFSQIKNNYREANYITFDGLGMDLNDQTKKFLESRDYFTSGLLGKTASYEFEDKNVIYQPLFQITTITNQIDKITLIFYGYNCKKIEVSYIYNTAKVQSYEMELTGPIIEIETPAKFIYLGELVPLEAIEVTAIETVLPNQTIKLQSVILGEMTILKSFKSHSLLEEINVLSSDLPMNSFECEPITDARLEIKENDPINVYSNGVYYGTFFVSESELHHTDINTGKCLYSLLCYNSIKLLDEFEYKVGYPRYVEETIREETGIIVDFTNTEGINIYGAIPIVSGREALCRIGYATDLIVDGSRNDQIVLKNIPTEITSIISKDRIIGNSKITISKTITAAEYKTLLGDYFNPSQYEYKDLALTNPANERTICYFEKYFQCLSTPSGTTVNDGGLHYIDFISSEENIVINGREITYPETSYMINNTLAKNQKANILTLPDFKLKVYDEYEQNKINSILKYIQSKGIISAKIILNNERVGDLIQIETAFNGIFTGIIISMNISFGYKDVADIEVLEWNL